MWVRMRGTCVGTYEGACVGTYEGDLCGYV